MSRTRIIALVFAAVALVQLALPASRIWQYETTLKEGTLFKFRTEPVDPYDAFRGRYVALSFDVGTAKWEGPAGQIDHGTPVFVRVETGADGFAKLGAASLEPPASGDYLKARASYLNSENSVDVVLPLDRFYMEESVAPEAEKVYQQSLQNAPYGSDVRRVRAHANIRILHGRGVIEQVFIGEQTLVEAARTAMKDIK